MYSRQQEEIKTVRERNIVVSLSDADCERISRLCGAHGLTVGQLIENFIGDLVDGTYTNGSDERMYAEKWFDRCWFGMFPDMTLLRYLLLYSCDYDVDGFLKLLEELDNVTDYWKQCQDDHEDLTEEDIELARIDYETTSRHYEELKIEFLEENPNADWEEEVKKVLEWHKRKIDF